MVLPEPSKLKVIRLSEVVSICGRSKTSIYLDCLKGVFPPPISLGERAKGYLEHEMNAVLIARVQGYSECQIKELVSSLVESRKHLAHCQSFYPQRVQSV
jgi:prophage regulatory protein